MRGSGTLARVSAADDLLNRASNQATGSTPAGPKGLPGASAAQQLMQGSTPQAPQNGGSAADQLLGAHGGSFVAQQGTDMTGTLREWYTGRNTGGTDNGWNTEFQKKFQDGYDAALNKGQVWDYYKQPTATGVVLWDNAQGKDGTLEFGDVVVDGSKVGNVYEDFDRHTANVMMGEYVVKTGQRKAELNEAGNDPASIAKAWDEEITKERGINTQQAEVAPRAEQLKDDVREELETDDDRFGVVATAFGGGAVLGGGLGSVIAPGIGTVIGAGIGGTISAVGAWLNSDSLTYQLAMSQEKQKLASAEGAGIASELNMLSQNFSSIALNPLQNWIKGTYDAAQPGGVTGGSLGGEFYETDAEGNRKAGVIWQALDMAAMFGDSALQLASPAGRLAYQAQMSAQISSGVIGLLPGQGQWDDTLLKQNSVWTSEEYNPETGKMESHVDVGNALAGVGTVAIDAVQLGGISSLSRGVDRLAASTAKATGQEAAGWAKGLQRWNPANFTERLNLSSAQRLAVKEGAEIETRSGYKFVVKDNGEIVGNAKKTLSMLAPSEGLQALTAKALARRDRAWREGGVRAEDLYNTASQLAMGTKGLTSILVNATGEAQEEVAQAILEPMSQDHAINADTVFRAALAGAFSGGGMTLGARFGMPSQDQRMYAAAAIGHMNQTNGAPLAYSDWQQMTDLQKRTAVKAAGAMSKAVTDGAFDKIESDMVDGMVSGVAGAARARDYVRDTKEAALAKGAEATDQASPIVMHESYTFRPDALSTSHHQLLMHQQDKTRAIQVQLDAMESKILELTTKNKVDPADTDIATQLAEAQANLAAHTAEIKASVTLERTIGKYVAEIDAAYADPDKAAGMVTAELKIDELNAMLEDMFDMTANEFILVMRDGNEAKIPLNADTQFAFSRAVSRLVTRDPADSKGSWPILAPQVNKIWASRNVNGLYGVSQIILQQIRGDYDGDKTRPLQQLVVPDQRYRDMRAGASIFGVEVMPDIGSSKYEQTLATRVMQSWDGDNATLADAARKVAADIEASLKTRYVAKRGRRDDLVDRKIIADISAAVIDALKNGQDVREIVLTMMSQRAGREILKVGLGEYWMPGQPKLSNEVYWIANMVTQHLDEFQQVYAEYTPNTVGPTPQRKAAQPKKVATDAQHRDPISGATEASNIIHELPGSNLFRMFQKLHYNLWNTTTKYVGWAHKASNPEYARLVEFYEALSQGVLKQKQERENANDKIIGDVLRMLERMAGDKKELEALGLSSLGDMALIANAGVPQMVYKTGSDGVRRMEYTGRMITIGQNLLYLSIENFKRENHKVWEQDPNLSAAVNSLSPLTQPQVQGTKKSRPGNAETAFVKIFENTRVYDLVGTDAHSLGVQRTVGQVFRELVNLSPDERTQQKYELRSGVYADSKKGFNIPFSEPELKSGSVTAYKSLIDSLFSAADSTITINRSGKDKGEVHGRYADKSDERELEIQEAWRSVQLLMRTFLPKTERYTAEDVVNLTNSNKEFGDALMKTLPDSVIPWALKRFDSKTGTPVFSKWFYEVWTQPTAEQAAMSYFRGLTLGKWFAMVRTLKMDAARGDKTAEKGIAYHRLDSRVHRVMFRLGANSVGNDEMLAMFEENQDRAFSVDSTPLKAFMTKLNEAQTTKEFFKYLNLEEGMVDEGAPLLPWMDEVALFDADKTNGGWTSKQSTPALLENITNLRMTANRLIGDFNKSVERSKSDVQTALAVQRWHQHLKFPDDTNLKIRDGDEETYNQFLDLLKRAARRRLVSGPRAMLQHTAHLAYGIYAPAHAKANNPEFLAANAALEALDNAIGYLTTPERALNDLTAHSDDSVAASPHMILRDGGTMMTRDGRQVTWDMNAVEAMLPLMLDAKQHPLMRTMLFDTVVELDSDNVARKKFLMGSTLDQVLKGNTAKKLYREKKNPDLTQAMKWLTLLEAELRADDKHVIEQKVTELVLARTTALDHPADFEEIQAMTTKAYIDFAVATQAASRTVDRPGQDDPAHIAGQALRQAALMAQVAATYKVDPVVLGDDMDKARKLIEDERIAPYRERVRALRKAAGKKSLSADDRDKIIALMESQQKVLEAMQAKVARMFDLNATDQIVAQYQYDDKADQALKTARQNVLIKYVYEHGELVKAAGPALQTVTQIMNHLGETPQNRLLTPLMLGEKAWVELSNVIISVEIGHLLTVGPADSPFPPYPTDENLQKYLDPSFSWLTDFLLPGDKSGILAASRRIAKEAGKVSQEVTAAELVTKVKNTLLRQGTLGTLTPEIPIQAIESYELLTGASAVPSVAMHGLLSQRWGAVMKATSRQETDTVADATVELSWRDLDWVRNGQFNDVAITAGNGETYTRPLAHLNNRFAEELSFTYGSATTPVDLMVRPNVAREWIRSNGTAPTSRFKSVNIDRLREEIGLILREMYPNASVETLDQMMAAVKVSMKFVNPDAQPAATQEQAAAHSNSLWHEGTVYESAGDTGPSLIEAYFFGPGGVNPRGQQSALDTRKLGLMGIEDYVRPTAEQVLKFEAFAKTDFGRMLAEKTKHFMDVKIGNNEPTSVHFYNAIYKLMKLKHWLEGTDPATGKRVRWSAEQVIDWQMKNPNIDIYSDQGPLRDAVLWKPSDPVLADMMGDIGYGGVSNRLLQRTAETDLNTIPRYKAWWSDLMEERFPVARSQPTNLTNTDVAQQSYVQDLNVSNYTTPQERTAFKRRWENMKYKMAAAKDDRTKDMQRKTFDPVANRKANQATAVGYVSTQDVRLNMPDEWKFMAASHTPLKDQVTALLQTYTSEQQARVGANGTSFWIFREDGTSATEEGLIMKGNLGGKLRIVPGEIVAFDVADYDDMDPEQARRIAEKRIKWFVDRGAAIMIVSSKGKSPLIAELQESTQVDHGYVPYENNNLILMPDVFDESVFQNVAAARSRLTAPSAIPISQQRLSFLFFDQQVEENTMWVPVRPGYRSKFDSVQAIFDLLPIDAHHRFNTAVTHDGALAVQKRLEGLNTSAGKAMVLKQSLSHLYDKDGKLKKGIRQSQVDKEEQDFADAWDRMIAAMPDRVAQNTSGPVPNEEFGTGDFIPLIGRDNELMLYRHGYKYPKDITEQLRNQTQGDSDARGLVVYSGEIEPTATTHRGTVSRILKAPGRGFRMELEIPVGTLGSKQTFEHNGMKYMRTNMPGRVQVPELAIFGQRDIDGYASMHDVMSKQATGGLGVGFAPWFAMVGIDFTEDVRKFFGQKNTSDAIGILRQISALGKKMTVEEIHLFQSLTTGQDSYLALISDMIPSLGIADVDIAKWVGHLQDDTAEAAIVRAMLVYLMSPGANVDAILGSSGFNVDRPHLSGANTQLMPELFTRAFDLSAPDSDIRRVLGERLNHQLNEDSNTGEWWHLNVNTWEVTGKPANGPAIVGMLQFGEAVVSDDNIEANLQAQARKDVQSATTHQALMNMIGTGGTIIPTRAQKKLDRLTDVLSEEQSTEAEPGSLWRDLTFVNPQTSGPGTRWQRRTVAEHKYYNRSLVRMGQYRHAISFKGDEFNDDREAINTQIKTIRHRLNLRPAQEELIHYWIRQMLYHPVEGKDQNAFTGDLAPQDVLGAAKSILENLDQGMLPTYNSAGPSFLSYTDLSLLFQAAQDDERAWRPSRKANEPLTRVSQKDIGEWIAVAFGQSLNEMTDFDPIYRLDFSGFMNTYQTVLKNSGYMMDISFDKQIQGRLLDPKTNELLTVTIDRVEETRLTEQVILATANLEYEDLLDGNTDVTDAAWRQRRLDARARWRARRAVPPVKVYSSRDYVRYGTERLNKDADQHSLQRIVIALRHGMAMLNPGLYFSMIPEQGFRMFLSEMTNLITGESTLRSVSGVGRAGNWALGKATGGRAQMTLTQYSPEQIRDLNQLFTSLGNDGAFTSLIIKDMMYQKNRHAPNKAVAGFEKFASIGNWWQDPTHGTTQKSMARHYVEAIMRANEALPGRRVMTVDSVIAALRTDPGYFAKHDEALHKMASNWVVDFRSLKQTPWSLAMKGIYDPWSKSANMPKRFVGTLMKMQLMYATYNLNVLTTITGMQGYTDMAAVFFDGKRKPRSFLKTWWKARNDEPITDEDYETIDMSSAIDGATIANAFIRGGVTQTGLFLLGMASGGILSGEDEETKRRRKLAEAQNVPLLMDPRRLENDFRNKDTIFLDWMPPQFQAFFRVQGDDGVQGARAAAQISWILKPFLSPILGMEKFFMTGDFGYVTHGFMDAVGSMPLFNIAAWDDTVRASDELVAMAADEQAVGTTTATKNATFLLTNAVAMYEHMLVENMFLNSLYAGFDQYDRDPTKLVLRDSDGDIQKTIEDNARENNIATKDYIADGQGAVAEGDVGTGYMKRDPLSAAAAAYTENNLTAAAVLSLFKPIHHQEFFRGDMPVTMRDVKLPEMSEAESKVAIIVATLNQQASQGTLERQLSLDEVTYMLKGKFMKDKDWNSFNNLDALAKQFYESDKNPVYDPLSILGKDGQEVLTKSGHAALFKGLMGGTITLDDPEMRGIFITVDQRKEIEKDFFTDYTRQGTDMGLTHQQAERRATRLMYGPTDNQSIMGFKEMLYDKRIPTSPNAQYKQLNTTYVTGPDGFPWATGYKRGGAPTTGGFWSLFGGLKRPSINVDDSMIQDSRMNSSDTVRGIDTGLRGLVPVSPTENIPTDYELTKMQIKAIDDAARAAQQGYTPNEQDTAGSAGRFYRSSYGGGGYGGGGGKGYSPTIYWSRQPTLPRGTNVYGNSAKNLFWNNANIRRTTIRRERYQSTRERLNQWQ